MSNEQLLRARVQDLLHLLSFAKIETPTPGDLPEAEKAMADIRLMLAQPAEGGEVVAWRGELAHGIDEHGKGQDWRWHTMEVKPQVPAHFIRNLRPLTYADTTPPASHDQDNDELDRLRKELNRIKLVGSCGTVDSWLSLSDEQKREWFATTLHRDSEQTKTIRELEHQLASQEQAQQPKPQPMTDAQMEEGRERIFSVNNPYCPCDRKTFAKVARYVERFHHIGITSDKEAT